MRIRHFGLLANRFRKQMLPLARTLLVKDDRSPLPQPAPMTPTEVAPLRHAQLCLEQLDSS